MLLSRHNALLRAQSFCAKILHYFRRRDAPAGSELPPLTPHILNDIGLSPTDEARLRHKWPSQTTRHPYL